LDTPTASPNGDGKDPEVTRRAADVARPAAGGGDSVEALEEALASARVRLQERLANEIEAQRHELDRLQQQCEQMRKDAEATVAKANETAQQVMHEANDTAEKTRREAHEGADQMRREANEAAEKAHQEAEEATQRMHQADETAERIVHEARDSAQRMLAHARDTATALLSRLRDHADTFLADATAEVASLQVSLGPRPAAAEPAAPSTTNGADSRSEEKDGPTRWIRSALKNKSAPANPTPNEEQSPDRAEKSGDNESPPAAAQSAGEAAVTRMIVRPLVGGNTRARIKDKLEGMPGIKAVKLGPIGDESFEVLIIHPREVQVAEGVLGLAPDEIVLKEQKVGYLEIELKDLGWVENEATSKRSA
jgi:F0F1-type ATP synthase membrane subunit b/b'